MAAFLGITPEAISNIIAGLVMLGLAVWLLVLDRRSKANLAFAFFLLMRGLLNLSLALLNQQQTHELGASLVPVFYVVVPFAALAFAVHYRNTYGVTDNRVIAPWSFYVAGAILVAAYALAPELWINGFRGGPLFAAVGLAGLSFALVALLLGREYIHAEPGPVRRSLLLVSLGFALAPTYVAGQEIVIVDLAREPLGLVGPWVDVSHYLADLALVPIVFLLTLMVRDWAREEDALVRPETKRYMALMLVAVATAGAGAFVFFGVSPTDGLTVLKVGEAIWELSLPLIVTYALLRHQLFDINLKLKRTVRQSAMAGSFSVIFFVTSESLEALVPVDSAILGMVAAGIISLVLVPVQKFAANVADKLMPGVKPFEELSRSEQLALYRDQVKIAIADGKRSEKDRRMLDVARKALGLGPQEAADIERQALAEAAKNEGETLPEAGS